MTFFKTLWRDQSGASAAEYALILAIVGTGIALAAWNLGTAIKNSMGSATNCIKNVGTGSAPSANC
ncbi:MULTISPECIES: Flp family type IVb pilin [Sphingobium]|uniref:Flp family type IVb pilin n=1 Tax=Sphingobium tyrosinilyticum TaxID=2715436 RepID=A0ABV9F7S8_9SPHN|nr:Flp family type IVb pilin [Sphingobium sp. EP60837]ANI78850.1 hypothetical protein EP837_02452 [Sphingobium sp. EP60837]